MEIKQRLEIAGVDVAGSVKRFNGNDMLYLKFAKKFLQDPNYGFLGEALAAKDYHNALTHAHTLKGVSANLGMNQLSECCNQLVQKFRAENYENLDEIFQRLQENYQSILSAIGE